MFFFDNGNFTFIYPQVYYNHSVVPLEKYYNLQIVIQFRALQNVKNITSIFCLS